MINSSFNYKNYKDKNEEGYITKISLQKSINNEKENEEQTIPNLNKPYSSKSNKKKEEKEKIEESFYNEGIPVKNNTEFCIRCYLM